MEALNDATPRSEWTEGPDGKPRGPWQAQHVVYLLDLKTGERFTWPTGTIGGARSVSDLVDKTKWMRRFRGPAVYPVVTLSDCFMNTRFGGRQRPHCRRRIRRNWNPLRRMQRWIKHQSPQP